jgi:hypothetical protein
MGNWLNLHRGKLYAWVNPKNLYTFAYLAAWPDAGLSLLLPRVVLEVAEESEVGCTHALSFFAITADPNSESFSYARLQKSGRSLVEGSWF